MAELVPTRPAIHLALMSDADAALERFAAFGAEEEGVPTRLVPAEGADHVAAAYAAARSSTFGVGLAIGAGKIALHEGHMPADRPVLTEALGVAPASVVRRFGANAARMVVRLPLRFGDPEEDAGGRASSAPERSQSAPETQIEPLSADDAAAIVARVVARLQTRGRPS